VAGQSRPGLLFIRHMVFKCFLSPLSVACAQEVRPYISRFYSVSLSNPKKCHSWGEMLPTTPQSNVGYPLAAAPSARLPLFSGVAGSQQSLKSGLRFSTKAFMPSCSRITPLRDIMGYSEVACIYLPSDLGLQRCSRMRETHAAALVGDQTHSSG
jgi:hypothetical protein